MEENVTPVPVKPYLPIELAKLYDTSKTTFNRDIRPHRAMLGKRVGNRWSIRQVEMIFGIMGRPTIER
jgi:hypothetical protein